MNNFIRKIEINIATLAAVNASHKVSATILNDFLKFKDSNELQYCSMKQEEKDDHIYVTFSSTIKYQSSGIDPISFDSKMRSDFLHFCEMNLGDYCLISKVTCQDNTYIVEFSIQFEYYAVYT